MTPNICWRYKADSYLGEAATDHQNGGAVLLQYHYSLNTDGSTLVC
jgi:hypothetical protein